VSKTWKAFLIISLVFNVAVISTLVFGLIRMSRIEESPRRRHYSRERVARRCRSLARDLDLPREKAEQFEQLMTGSEVRTDSVRTRLRSAREELFELIWAESPQYETVMRKVDEVAVLQGEVEKLLIKNILDARSILDPEEEERFLRHMRNRMGPLPHHERRPAGAPHRNGGRH
jgi:Spy/CpxP family protein refolding chaperone